MQAWSIKPVSEDCLLVEWQAANNEFQANEKSIKTIASLANYLLAEYHSIIVNVTPAYQSCLVQFDVLKTKLSQVKVIVEKVLARPSQNDDLTFNLHQIPVFYDPVVAVDLTQLCTHINVSIERLIELHTTEVYNVYAVGFLPGFSYLGYVPNQIAAARHSSFRGMVPAGSVAIADRQTAIYPSDSPGGWQIIGRTPVALMQDNHSILKTADKVQFTSISRAEYLSLGGAI
ncbi:MAG: allophanate hydrolase subunit 1 [Acidiferrobacterales bacterium]|nr:allophanate hydrolase subunit 1 [Acidiferrobacterales bacterium]